MNNLFYLKKILYNNKLLIYNILGAFIVKGLGLVLSVFSLPLYMNFFPDNKILGVWFTIVTILNWILSFDLGIGNGLRNNLTKALAKDDLICARIIISSSYVLIGLFTILVSCLFILSSDFLDWNKILNISETKINSIELTYCINIVVVGVLISFFLRLINAILYALQYSTANNLISFLTQFLIVSFLFLVSPRENLIENLRMLSMFYTFATILPLLIATLLVFYTTRLKKCIPNLRFFDFKTSEAVLSLGSKFLIGQILYMIMTLTNELFISKYYGPEYCVDYQIYYKIFFVILSLYQLALTPLWSAVTKAYTEKKYKWLIGLRNILYFSTSILIIVQLAFIPFMQQVLDLWLRDRSIDININYALAFLAFSIINIWISNNAIFNAGLGALNVTIICNFIAVIIKVLGIVLLSHYFDSWIFVVIITCIAYLPYCVFVPVKNNKILAKLNNCANQN